MSLATKGSRRLFQLARFCAFKALSIYGHMDFVKFIVLTRSRTGSNLLLSFLNGHPSIVAEGEIFATLKGKDPLVRLSSAFGKQPRHVKAKGFKIFYYHPLDANADELWAHLQALQEIKVIHLTRQNVLRTLLSRKIAETKGVWTATRFDTAEPSAKRVSLTVEELQEGFNQTREWEERAIRQFRGHPLLHITYEELVHSPEQLFGRVITFLGVPDGSPRTSLRQQNPERLRDLLQNYDELKAEFTGTQWERYFND